MSILDRVAKLAGYTKAESVPTIKESQSAGLDYASWEATQGVAPATSDDLLATYSICDAVYRAVDARASAIAGVPLRFWRGKSDDDKTEITGDLSDLFWKPNAKMGYEELIKSIMLTLDLIGTAYLEKAGVNSKSPIGRNNLPRELYWLPANRVRILRDRTRGVFAYRQRSKYGDKKVDFEPDRIAMFKYLDPRDIDGPGLSPLAAARQKVTLDLNATTYNSKFFEHGAEPGGLLIKKEGKLTPDGLKRIRENWKQAHAGVGKAHRIGILDDGMDYKQIGITHKDMQFLETMKFSLESILRVYGVPPVVAGVLEHANYSISVEQKKLFWTLTLIPIMRMIAGVIDRSICQDFGDDVWSEFDLSTVVDLREDDDRKAVRARTLVDGQILTINEVRREYYGRGPVAWGDLPPIPAGAGFFPTATSGPMKIAIGRTEQKHIRTAAKAYTAEEQKALWESFIKRVEPAEVSMRKAVARFFQDQAGRIGDKLGVDKSIDAALTKSTDINNWMLDPDSEFWTAEDAEAYEALQDYIRGAVQRGVDSVTDDFGESTGDDFDWKDPKVVKFLREKKLKLGRDINRTTYEGLKKILAASTDEGQSIAQLAKRIGDYYDDMAPYRAERIARTEVVGALNFGTLKGYEIAGYTHKGWLAQFDEFARDTHKDASRSDPIPLYDRFNVGDAKLLYPGDPSAGSDDVGEIVNCRCTLIPYVE